MSSKKACVLYTSEKYQEALKLQENLEPLGFVACLTEVTAEIAQQLKAEGRGELPAEVTACLDGAEICFVLVSDTGESGCAGQLAGMASDAGCRVVSVGGSPDDLPEELDDIIDGHLPGPDSPKLPEIISGESIRVRSDNTEASSRKEDRVKCQ